MNKLKKGLFYIKEPELVGLENSHPLQMSNCAEIKKCPQVETPVNPEHYQKKCVKMKLMCTQVLSLV